MRNFPFLNEAKGFHISFYQPLTSTELTEQLGLSSWIMIQLEPHLAPQSCLRICSWMKKGEADHTNRARERDMEVIITNELVSLFV